MSSEEAVSATTPTTFEPESAWIEQLQKARAALAEVAPRFLALLRAVQRPDAIAVGSWRIADLAAHMSHLSAGEVIVAKAVGLPVGEGFGVGDDIIAAASGFNAGLLEGDPERDVAVLTDRIEQNIGEFLDAMADARGCEAVPWLAGVVLPSSAPACHLLEELLVHGYDVARAEGKPWPIAADHAALGFGFLLDLMRFASPAMRRNFVDQDAAAGVRACFDFRMRGERRDFISFEDGLVTIEEPSDRPVDCHISAHPVAALLMGMGRIGPGKPALTGRVVAWGRRPWLAFKLTTLLKNP